MCKEVNHIETIENLYKNNFHIIFKHLINLGCSKENAEDIVQNTFYKALENNVHMEVSNFSAWLFKVSINEFYDLYRKKKRFPKVTIDEPRFIDLFLQEESSEELILLKELRQNIRALLDELKASHKNLLLLKYELGLSYEAIASMLGIKVETIRTTLYRARNEFKEKWSGKDERRK